MIFLQILYEMVSIFVEKKTFRCVMTKQWLDWNGFFYDGTRPSGHISRPTHLNVARSCFHSLNKIPKPDFIAQVWGLVEVYKFHQIRGDLSKELCRMSDRSYQIGES